MRCLRFFTTRYALRQLAQGHSVGRWVTFAKQVCTELFPQRSVSLQRLFRRSPVPRQHLFRLGIALSAPLWIPVTFRLAAFAFWDILFPLEDYTAVAFGLPNSEGRIRTLSEFPRSARGGDMVALGLLFTPGAGCSQSTFSRCRFPCAPTCSYQPFRAPKLTKPHQGFIHIILSNLALACTLNLALKVLRHLTLSADFALPLLVEHSKADIRLNTSGERLLGALSNSPERLRVARITAQISGSR